MITFYNNNMMYGFLKINKFAFLCRKFMQAIPIRSLAVFCGSKNGATPLFMEHAVQLGKILVTHTITLVYGGGNVGIMGTIANAVMDHGGKAIGVIPQVLVDWERQHNSLSELLVVDDMHSRKKKMYELCDAAIILPGGFGTLDELFEMVTWNQLSIHDKQIFILNSAGFYNHLLAHIQQMEKEKFLYETAQKRLTIISEPSELIRYL
jgi:uncharacterized protein (TIGR00730 family)